MDDPVPVTVLSPSGDAPRPTVYLLDGADGGADVSDWLTKGGAESFFAGRNVNVVLPAGGAGSFTRTGSARTPSSANLSGRPSWSTNCRR